MYDVDGWVEITHEPPERHEGLSLWMPLLALGPFSLAGDRLASQLFGLAKQPVDDALFAARGIPADATSVVLAECNASAKLVAEHGEGDHGHTHASWEEIVGAPWEQFDTHGEWAAVFDMVEAYRARRRPAGVRVIAWGNW